MNPGSPGDTGDEWITIKVAAAFSGLRFLPCWLGTASNSANPLLEIGPRGVRYRVLRLREVNYEQIDEVDLRTAWRTVNLCFRFRDAVATFSANVRHLDEATRALGLMEGRAPLSDRARDLVVLRAAGNPVVD
jgi:hypothetical protein